MMLKLRNWYVRNQDSLTWYVIGLLTMSMLSELAERDYWMALLSAVLIWANYKFSKIKLQ